jgi:hypothetical protein
MENNNTIKIFFRFLSLEDRKLLIRKGFKLLRIYRIPGGLYKGPVFILSIPDDLKIYPTTESDTFILLHNKGSIVLSITYMFHDTAGIITFRDNDYWK